MALWLMAAALLCFFENNTGTRVIMQASLLIPLSSILCAWWTARRLNAFFSVPVSCKEGQPADVYFTLSAPFTRWGCCIRAALLCTNRMTEQAQTLFAGTSGILPLDTSVCGVMDIHVTRIMASDWFGISSFRSWRNLRAELTILPALHSVQLRLSASQSPLRETPLNTHTGRSTDETMGIRPYVPGDPVRMIHWKLSARLDEFFVRETGNLQEDRVLLLLDASCAAQANEADRVACVKSFLSAAQAFCSERIPFLACTIGDTPGDLCVSAVTCQEENNALTSLVLRTSLTAAQASIGTLFASRYPQRQAAHVVLFAPCAETDAASLYHGQRVTLVLPHTRGIASGGAEIAVHVLDENHTQLEL